MLRGFIVQRPVRSSTLFVPDPSVHTRQPLRLVAAEGIGFASYRAIRRMSFKSRSGRRGGQVRRCGFPRPFRFFQASRRGPGCERGSQACTFKFGRCELNVDRCDSFVDVHESFFEVCTSSFVSAESNVDCSESFFEWSTLNSAVCESNSMGAESCFGGVEARQRGVGRATGRGDSGGVPRDGAGAGAEGARVAGHVTSGP